jgi:hypothetical protein
MMLFILAVVLSYLILPLAMVYTLIKPPFGGRRRYLRKAAISIDQTGNAIGGYALRALLVQKNAPVLALQWWGNPDVTISFALAKCKGYETGAGRFLVWFLEYVDPGHMKKAIDYETFK